MPKLLVWLALRMARRTFFHLLLPPLFPWIKDAFGLSYAELGFLMTVFFIVSGIGQFLAGFLVDRYGALQVLLGGMALMGLSAIGLAMSSSYVMLMFFAGVAGLGNSIFHPSDFTILNRRVSQPRLAHAFSWHGVAGSIGWAIAPPILAGLAALYSWHVALLFGAVLAFIVLGLLVIYRERLDTREIEAAFVKASKNQSAEGSFDFMKSPAVWMCFAFFAFTAMALGVIQSFTPAALNASYGVRLRYRHRMRDSVYVGERSRHVSRWILGGAGSHNTIVSSPGPWLLQL